MSFWDSLKYIPNRILNAISKLIGMKGVALFTTYHLISEEMIPEEAVVYAWCFIILIVVFGEKALTVFKDIKK